MSALGHYIERAGVVSVAISLIREQSESIGPPRALWVPFPLGRPLGSATDPEFQKTVMRQACVLLETASEPTIADYVGDDPNTRSETDEADDGPWACPLNLAMPVDDTLTGRLLSEVANLRPWAMQTRTERGRTLFGATGASPDQVDDIARAVGAIAEGASLTEAPSDAVEWTFEMPLLIRHLVDDLRTNYHEAIASQPGAGSPTHDDLNDWIFGSADGSAPAPGTVLGETLLTIADRLAKADDPMCNLVCGFIIPEGRFHGGSAF